MIVDELGRIPMSPSLASSLARAAGYAEAQLHREVTLEHLLLALTEDADAAQILSASHIDLARVVTDVSGMLGRIEDRNAPEHAGRVGISPDLKRILEAAAAASRGRRREINGAIVLAAIVGDGRAPAAHILRSQGLTFEDAIRVLQRAMAQPSPPPQAAAEPVAPAPAPHHVGAPAHQAEPHLHHAERLGEPPAPPFAEAPVAAAVTEDLLAGARARINRSRVEPPPPAPAPRAPPPAAMDYGADYASHGAPAQVTIAEEDAAAGYGYEPYRMPASAPAASDDAGVPHAPPHDYAAGYPTSPAAPPPMADEALPTQPATPGPLDAGHAHGWQDLEPLPPHYRHEPAPEPAPPPELPRRPLSSYIDAVGDAPAGEAHAPSWTPPPLPRTQRPAAPPPLPSDVRVPRGGSAGPQRPVTPGAAYPPALPSFREPQVPPNPIYPPWPPVDMAPPAQPTHGEHVAPPLGTLGHEHEAEAYRSAAEAQSEAGQAYGEAAAAPWPLPPPPQAPHGQPAYMPQPAPEAMPLPSAGYGPGPSFQQPLPSPLPPPMAQRADAPGFGSAAADDAPLSAGDGDERRHGRGAGIEIGQLIEKIPRAMRVAVPVVVEVRIAKADVKALADGMAGQGQAYRHEIVVTKAMSVRLRAPDGGFFIETTSPETQWLENKLGLMADDYASWRWTVTPRTRGRHRLQLVIAARTVGRDGLTAESSLPEQVIDVRVKTNYGLSARRWGGWIAAAIIGGVLQRFSDVIIAAGAKLASLLAAG